MKYWVSYHTMQRTHTQYMDDLKGYFSLGSAVGTEPDCTHSCLDRVRLLRKCPASFCQLGTGAQTSLFTWSA